MIKNKKEIKEQEKIIKNLIIELTETLLYLEHEIKDYKIIFHYIAQKEKVIKIYNQVKEEIDKLKEIINENDQIKKRLRP